MPDKKISALTAGATLATTDLIPIVDVSDTTMADSGTTKAYPLSVLDGRYVPSDPSGAVNATGGVIFPTSDPMVIGAFWNNNGSLVISAAS